MVAPNAGPVAALTLPASATRTTATTARAKLCSMRKLIGILGLFAVVAALVVPVASGSDFRGRYQLRLDGATGLIQPAPAKP
jgi:hypothetical protein